MKYLDYNVTTATGIINGMVPIDSSSKTVIGTRGWDRMLESESNSIYIDIGETVNKICEAQN